MRFTADLEELTAAVEYASKQVSRNPAMAVYSGLLVEADEDEVAISGSDGQVSVEARLSANVTEEGRTLVPAAGLVGWLRGVGRSGKVELWTEADGLCGRTDTGHTCRLVQIQLTFPKVGWPGGDRRVDLTGLGEALKAVAHATRDGDGLMSNILIRIQGSQVACVATDSFRLARVTGDMISAGDDYEIIVPREVSDRVASMGAGEGTLAYAGGHVVGFRTADGRRSVLSRVAAGRFPSADHLLGRDCDHDWVVDRRQLAETLTRLRPFAGGRDLFILELGGGRLVVEASSEDIGEATETIEGLEGSSTSGEDLRLGIAAAFLHQAVAALKTDRIRLRADSDAEPILISGDGDTDHVELIAPVRFG